MSESGNQEATGASNGSGGTSTPKPSFGNKVTVVLGAQWGDEGKGKVVDLLAQDADMVCRCQVRAPPASHNSSRLDSYRVTGNSRPVVAS